MSESRTDQGTESEVVISVRGEAIATVDPDLATVHLGLSVTADSKSEASLEAGRLIDGVVSGLAALGGQARSAQTDKHPMTWATTSVSSYPEFNHDQGKGPQGRTGRTVAAARLEVRVRDFELLPALQAVLDDHRDLETDFVGWHVDPDNPVWRLVRTGAIKDAITRGGDYANALGGELTAIQHLADTGLLAGADRSPVPRAFAARSAGVGRPAASAAPQPPLLDPLPQVVSAVVEARFIASGITLKSG